MIGSMRETIGWTDSLHSTSDPNAAKGKKELDKNDFLKLLVTQLTHQDPTNPVEDKEFSAQMAQFSSLEQLTNISKGVDSLNSNTQRQDMISAVNYIGKQIRAKGDSLSKADGKASTVYYTLEEAVGKHFINIFDSAGGLVNTVHLGQKGAGTYEFTWDGKDYKGKDVADGVYTIGMAAQSAEGDTVLVNTDVSGEVSGMQNQNGLYVLRLKDGRTVQFANVKEVVNPQAAASS